MIADSQTIKAVTFDLWETLLLERDGASIRRQFIRCKHLVEVLSKFGIQVSLEQMELAIKKAISSITRIWELNRDVECLDQIRLILKYSTCDHIVMKEEWVKELVSAYMSPILEVPPYLNPDAPMVLEKLSRNGKRMGLICNTGLTPGAGLRKFLAKEGVTEYFDVMVFSEEIGVRKPDAKIFHYTTRKLRAKPEETVHVGDNLKMDVWGAKCAGLRAIHFSSEEGRDKLAESDPNSLVSLSRRLGDTKKDEILPDKVVDSLSMVVAAIEELESRQNH